MSMEQTDLDATQQEAPRAGFVEHAVPPAMLVVAIAMGVAGHLHLGLTQEFAAAVGLALYCIMLLCHVLLRAADAADRAAEEEVERRIAQVPSPIPPPVPQAPAETLRQPAVGLEPLTPPLMRDSLPSEADTGHHPAIPPELPAMPAPTVAETRRRFRLPCRPRPLGRSGRSTSAFPRSMALASRRSFSPSPISRRSLR